MIQTMSTFQKDAETSRAPLRLRTLNLTSGETIAVSEHLTVVVGPNNVGKSSLLNAIWAALSSAPNQPITHLMPPLASIEAEVPDVEGVIRLLNGLTKPEEPGQSVRGYFQERTWLLPNLGNVTESQVHSGLMPRQPAPQLGQMIWLFAINLTPEARLGQLGQVQIPNLYTEVPHQPLQKLWANRELEEQFNSYSRRAFGLELTVNRHAGMQTALHIGRPTQPEPRIGEPGPYLAEIAALPQAAGQGHGVQAFLGIVQALISQTYDLVLIDEPEAFLHPPQARMLGEIFVELSRGGTQVLVSTHSDDFLQGVLLKSASQSDVTVVRLTRPSSDANHVAQVPSAALRRLYEDPLLRYSNVLNGVFYKGVVVCESEADCRYYSAVLDAAIDEADPRADLMFTQVGGKDRIAKAVFALRAAEVPTAVIADIDLLADKPKYLELLTLLGGQEAEVSADLNTIAAWVRTVDEPVNRQFARHVFEKVLAVESEAASLSEAEIKELRDVLSKKSGWKLLKQKGRGAIASGDPTRAFNAVLATSAKCGLFLVPVGELESFHPEIGGTKAQWLRTVFETDAYAQANESRDLVTAVARYIASCQ